MTTSTVSATRALVDSDSRGVVVTVIAGNDMGEKGVLDETGSCLAGRVPESLGSAVVGDALELMARERSATLTYGDTEVFFEVIVPRPVLFVFGAVHVAQELVQHASLLGFRTVVADPRPAFVTADRFPEADELRVGWPAEVCDVESLDDRTFVVVLTHDRRFEDPLWPIVLPSKARYVGAMGSAKTTARRAERLLADGFSEEQIGRIHGPVGLDIGSRTAGETAIAILGEMIVSRYLRDAPVELTGVPTRV